MPPEGPRGRQSKPLGVGQHPKRTPPDLEGILNQQRVHPHEDRQRPPKASPRHARRGGVFFRLARVPILHPSGASPAAPPPVCFRPWDQRDHLETTMQFSRPLESDSACQRWLHRGVQFQRRKLMSGLLSLWDEQKQTAKLEEATPAIKLAGKISACGRYPSIMHAEKSGSLVMIQGRCNSRSCPTCVKSRASDMERRVREAVKQIDDARLITLTLKSEDRPLADQIKHLRESFVRLRRSKDWKASVIGGISVVETTWNPKTRTWHPHLHVIADGTFFAQPILKKAWAKASGGSDIVDIRRVASRDALAKYVAKYVSKSIGSEKMQPQQRAELALAMHGLRLCQTFGTLHGQLPPREKRDADDPLETIAPISPLAEQVARGSNRARRIMLTVQMACKRSSQNRINGNSEQDVRRIGRVARRLRRWWWHVQNPPDHRDRENAQAKKGRNHRNNRSLRLWEDNTDAADGETDGAETKRCGTL